MTVLKIVLIAFLAVSLLFCYSCCVVSKRSEERIAKMKTKEMLKNSNKERN